MNSSGSCAHQSNSDGADRYHFGGSFGSSYSNQFKGTATRNIPNVDKQAKPASSVTLSVTTRGLAKTVILKVSAKLG